MIFFLSQSFKRHSCQLLPFLVGFCFFLAILSLFCNSLARQKNIRRHRSAIFGLAVFCQSMLLAKVLLRTFCMQVIFSAL